MSQNTSADVALAFATAIEKTKAEIAKHTENGDDYFKVYADDCRAFLAVLERGELPRMRHLPNAPAFERSDAVPMAYWPLEDAIREAARS